MANFKFYVDDVLIGQEALMTVLGIDPKFIPKNKIKDFEVSPNILTKKGIGVSTKFNAWSQKEDRFVEVRIAEAVTKKNIGGQIVHSYKPSQLFFHGRNKSGADPQEFFWLNINPDAEGSPFRKPNAKWRYRFIDDEAKATKEIHEETIRTRAMAIILGENALTINQLRQIAKGMGIAGVDDLTGDQVRSQLRALAAQNPVSFYEKCKDKTILFNGKIQDAIDKSILYIKTESGLRKWFFDGEELAIIPSNADSVKIILNYVAENAQELYPKIADALNGMSSSQIIKSSNLDGLFDEFDLEKKNTPPAPPSKEVTGAVKEDTEEMAKLNKLSEYADALDLPKEEYDKLPHMKKQAIEKRTEEINAHRESDFHKAYKEAVTN